MTALASLRETDASIHEGLTSLPDRAGWRALGWEKGKRKASQPGATTRAEGSSKGQSNRLIAGRLQVQLLPLRPLHYVCYRRV